MGETHGQLDIAGDLITAPEAARVIGVNRYTFYKWLKRGFVPHHRFGRIIRVSFRDLGAFIDRAHTLPIGFPPRIDDRASTASSSPSASVDNDA